MEVAVALYGPFVFSDGKRPISPILWLCPQEKVILSKPVDILLPHTLIGLSSGDIEVFGIKIAKASHDKFILTPDGEKKYEFQPYDVEVELKSIDDGSYASVKVEHCCFWCLEMYKTENVSPNVARQMLANVGYCIHCIECFQSQYPHMSPPKDVVYFCVSYFLKTCIKVFMVMYSCVILLLMMYTGSERSVSFNERPWRSDPPNPYTETHFEGCLPEVNLLNRE